jgi:hypothetical protein
MKIIFASSLAIGAVIGFMPALPVESLVGSRLADWISLLLLPGAAVNFPFGGPHDMNFHSVLFANWVFYSGLVFFLLRSEGRRKLNLVSRTPLPPVKPLLSFSSGTPHRRDATGMLPWTF